MSATEKYNHIKMSLPVGLILSWVLQAEASQALQVFHTRFDFII
jgi:hypothetical protein